MINSTKRWWILALICVIEFQDIYSEGIFGFVNDVASAYFQTQPSVTDILSTCFYLTRGLSGLVMSLFAEYVNFRMLSRMTTIFLTTGSVLVTCGVYSRLNYPIVVIGQFSTGLAATIAVPLAFTMSSNWFPENERTTVLTIALSTKSVSRAISNIVVTKTIRSNQTLNVTEFTNQDLIMSFKNTFSVNYVSLSIISFVCFILVRLFVTDFPQTTVIKMIDQKKYDVYRGFSKLRSLFNKDDFCIIFWEYILFFSLVPMIDVLFSSIVLSVFPQQNDDTVGTMLCVSYAAGWITSFVSSKLLDRLGYTPKIIALLSICSVIVGCISFSLGLKFKSYVLVFMSNVLICGARDVVYVCINFSTITTCKNPHDRITVLFILMSPPWLFMPVCTSFVRFLLQFVGPVYSVLFPIPFFAILCILHLRLLGK
ncbi:uncharacterized protein LOC144429891 [Styela clava]